MSNTRKVALNGNAGAFTSITAQQITRWVEIREDEAAAATGLQYQLPDDNFATTYTIGAPTAGADGNFLPQIVLGNKLNQGRGQSPIIGFPQQPSPTSLSTDPGFIAAKVYIKLRGNGAGATNVRVTEFD